MKSFHRLSDSLWWARALCRDLRLHHRGAVGEDLVQRAALVARELVAAPVRAGELVVDLVGEQHAVLAHLADLQEAALGEIEDRRGERGPPDGTPVHEPADDGGWIVGEVAHVLADLLGRCRLLAEPSPEPEEREHATEDHDRPPDGEGVACVALAPRVLARPGRGRRWRRAPTRPPRGGSARGAAAGWGTRRRDARAGSRRGPRRRFPRARPVRASAPCRCRPSRHPRGVRGPTPGAGRRRTGRAASPSPARSSDDPRPPISSTARRCRACR